LKAFEQASALQPDNEQAAVGQYISLVQLNRAKDGAKVLDQWVAAKADDPRRWLCMAMAEAESDQPEEALKSFEKLTELQPNESGNWVGKGEMLVALKRAGEALKAFDQAIRLNPKHEAAWNDRGGVLLRLGKYDEAIQSYDQSIELAPKWADSFYHRACAYAGKGDQTNALADLKKAIELQPSLKAEAVKEAGFKSLSSDPDFKKLTE
jgi:tetratricopeptide (TPR) repeat protein